MADAPKQPFGEEIMLLAEKLGELTDRLARIETEHQTQTVPLDAAKGAQDSALKALEAALTGIKALQFHVLENNLGGVSQRLSEVEKQADTAIKALDEKLDAAAKAIAVVAQETLKRFELTETHRTELAQKREDDAQTLERRFQAVSGDLAQIKNLLLERIEAARKEFAEPKGFNPRGTWDSQQAYARLDVVTVNGSSFVSTEDGNREKPGKGSAKWQELARRGAAAGGAAAEYAEAAAQITLTDGATITWNLSQPAATVTLAGNRTFVFSNPRAGGSYILVLKQGGSGSNTVTWPSAVKWVNGTTPILTTTTGKADIISLYYDGTVYYGTMAPNFATS